MELSTCCNAPVKHTDDTRCSQCHDYCEYIDTPTVQHSERGFEFIEFKDLYGIKCSLQQSSLATEAAVWLGVDDVQPQILAAGSGWIPVPFPEGTLFRSRMHLNRDGVQALITKLQKWIDTESFE